jgi:hypothetical protein
MGCTRGISKNWSAIIEFRNKKKIMQFLGIFLLDLWFLNFSFPILIFSRFLLPLLTVDPPMFLRFFGASYVSQSESNVIGPFALIRWDFYVRMCICCSRFRRMREKWLMLKKREKFYVKGFYEFFAFIKKKLSNQIKLINQII